MKLPFASLCILVLAAPVYAEHAQDYNHKPTVRSVKRALDRDRIEEITIKAIDVLVRVTAVELTLRGYREEARDLLDEWQSQEMAFMGLLKDIGDHAPLNEWLADKYDRIVELLPPDVIADTRIPDIKTFNYAIPVVFDAENPAWDKDEYRLHFSPFAGAVTYWTVWGACQVASLGTGVSYMCGAAGTNGERIMLDYFADRISDRVYDRANR